VAISNRLIVVAISNRLIVVAISNRLILRGRPMCLPYILGVHTGAPLQAGYCLHVKTISIFLSLFWDFLL